MTPAGRLCGEVNAKNGYGAYTGFKRFMSASDSDAYVDGLGYVGAEKSMPTHELLANMDARRAVLSNVLQVTKDSDGAITYTEDQIDRLTESAVFERRWVELCAGSGVS